MQGVAKPNSHEARLLASKIFRSTPTLIHCSVSDPTCNEASLELSVFPNHL